MSQDVHTVSVSSKSTPLSDQGKLKMLMQADVANVIGSGAGAAVVTAVVANLPAKYNVQITPSQDAVAYVSGKTQAGFNVTLLPRLAANTLAVGTFDVLVFA